MNPSSSASASSSASSQGGDKPATHLVELTSNTVQVIKVDAGAVTMSRNAALDNKATLELLLNDAASDWQENGWSGAVGSFLPATSWHLVTEEQVRAVGGDATLGALSNSLEHGFAGTTVVAGCTAGKGAPVETGGENRWLIAVAPTEGLDKALALTERCKLRPNPIGPGVLDHIGAISRLLRVTGQESVALWELGLDRSHLFLVTVNGVEAVVPCALKLTEVWETIRTELNLKYQLAAARLFYGDLFDFSDSAPRIAGQLLPALTSAYSSLPSKGEKPALACAGLTATQNWLVNHLAASLGTTNWQPDPETILGELGLHVAGDLLPGQLTPATFGLLHRASVQAVGTIAWKPVWHPAEAASFRIALPVAQKTAAPAPAPAPKAPEPVKAAAPAPKVEAPKPTAPAPAPKPAPIPTPIPAPKAPTPVPRPAQPAPLPTPAPKPAQPAPAPVVKAPVPAPQPAPAAKAPVPAPQPAKPAEAPKASAPAPVPAKPVQPVPQPAAKAPTPAPQPTPAPAAKAQTPQPAPAAKAPTPAPQPAPAAKAPAPAAQPTKPAPQPAQTGKVSTPAPAPAKAAATPAAQPGAKKKAPMGAIAGIAAAIVIAGAAFWYISDSGKKAEQTRIETQRVLDKAKADAAAAQKAADQAKADAAAAAAKQNAEAQAEIARLKQKAEEEVKQRQITEDKLRSAPGVIKINTEPEGAEVSVDGATPQVTPATIIDVTPGLRKITVRLPGYDTVEQLAQIKGMQTVDLGTIALQRLYGELMLRSEPADAEFAVFPADQLDAAPLRTGRTPSRVDSLLPGDYVIKFTRQGLLPTTEHATIAGKDIIDVNSTFIVGGVSITSNPVGATVRMNGESLGITPIIRPELLPGLATFEFSLPNHEPLKRSGEITSKETLRLHAELLHVDRIAKISEVKSPPKVLQKSIPSIPADLGEIKGEVVISLVVSKLGTIRDIRVEKSTNPALTDPCLKAINLWKFGPAISKAGQPVNMRIMIPIPIDIKPAAPEIDDRPMGFRR